MNSYRHKANSAASTGQNGTEFYTVMTVNSKPQQVYYGALLVSKEHLLSVAPYWCQKNIYCGALLVSKEHLLWCPTGVKRTFTVAPY